MTEALLKTNLKICWLLMYYRIVVQLDMELDPQLFKYNKPVHAR